jgi:hypothetical protein
MWGRNQQGVNSETIEIRKMVYSYRKKVLASIEREK